MSQPAHLSRAWRRGSGKKRHKTPFQPHCARFGHFQADFCPNRARNRHPLANTFISDHGNGHPPENNPIPDPGIGLSGWNTSIPDCGNGAIAGSAGVLQARNAVPRKRECVLYFNQVIPISFSRAWNSGSPVTSWPFFSLARAAAQASASESRKRVLKSAARSASFLSTG